MESFKGYVDCDKIEFTVIDSRTGHASGSKSTQPSLLFIRQSGEAGLTVKAFSMIVAKAILLKVLLGLCARWIAGKLWVLAVQIHKHMEKLALKKKRLNLAWICQRRRRVRRRVKKLESLAARKAAQARVCRS